MSAAAPEATGNDSKGRRSAPDSAQVARFALLLRGFLGVAGVAGVILLIVATRATIIQIRIVTTGQTASGLDTALSGADRHGPALIVVGVFAAVMLVGALQGARPAMAALALSGVLALGIAIASDASHIHDTGQVGRLYTQASAGAGNGFYFETLGGALLLLSGGGLLLLSGGAEAGGTPPRSRRRESDPEAADEAPAATRATEDWFSES